ncbi:type I-E CRISPR-associated protein Cse1/CasA [Cellulomonas uda]|uniref:Type I-E CRISPR-associated protein Cse1/CasA n=1 Tax=Cellulomonas uda TaxID=1714 RepID=A0A4Y3KBA3_CELUD|nr:type I-E CRISPR-associated protein Cse1/CasA [Cellulomonas uda]NII65224.1 CRISPR system Cascade subunit CasA [Cellulomonas uda]GEA81729.1 type I-E CRISPR-associated protein Cse1/CasA [Cellulomonas uda]
MDEYSLVTERWISVLTLDGRSETVSLSEAFERAHELREIVGDLPTQSFAILRLVLAIAARAYGGPRSIEDWQELWSSDGRDFGPVAAYLAEHRERFDLFHPHAPFFQTSGLRTAKGEFSALEKLVADVPAGFQYFTTRAGRGLERVSAAEAARWLVHLQAFDISGIKSGAVGDPRVRGGKGYPIGTGFAGNLGGLYVDGGNLWRTILLNTVPLEHRSLQRDARDRPSWEAPPLGPEEAEDIDDRPYGPLDLFTWQSRRVLLQRDGDEVVGVLVANGDRLTPQNLHRHEPLTAWRHSEPQSKKFGRVVYMPREHHPGRALWRGLAALLPVTAPRGISDGSERFLAAAVVEWAGETLGGTDRVSLRTAGMVYGPQSSSVADVVDDRLVVPVALLGQSRPELAARVVESVAQTERAVAALGFLAADLARAAGAREPSILDGVRDEAQRLAYAGLDASFRAWLTDLDPDGDADRQICAWHRAAALQVARVADDIVASAGPDAWVGREVNGRHLSTAEVDARFRAALRSALPLSSSHEEAVA